MRQVWSRSHANYYYGYRGCQHRSQLCASPERVAQIKKADAHLIQAVWSVVKHLQVAKTLDFCLGSSAWGTSYIQEVASKRPCSPGSMDGKRENDKRKKCNAMVR